MPFRHPDGTELFSFAEYAKLTDLRPFDVRADAAPFHAYTPAALLASWALCRETAWKFVGPEDRDAAHPALRDHMAAPFHLADRGATLAALEDDGYEPNAPLSDDAARAILGPGLWAARSHVFRDGERPFFDASAVEAGKRRRVEQIAEIEARSEGQALSRSRRMTNNAGSLTPEERSAAYARAIGGDRDDPSPATITNFAA
jgi:hypothetical protein